MASADGFPTTLCTPTSYTKVTSATDPITAALRAAQAGDLIELSAGNFRRCGPFTSGRPLGLAPVEIRGQGNATTILRDPSVGSTDAIYLGPNDHDTYWRNLAIQADDRAAIKTVSGVGPGHAFENVNVYGMGGPWDPAWHDDSKWGIHGYDTARWTEINVAVMSIFQEHAHYFHNLKGNHAFTGGVALWCGRTAFQFVNRVNEGGPGVGNITIKNHYAEDVCLEDGGGGSAYTFRGGMPETDILIDTCYVKLGGVQSLAAPFNRNITGSIVCSRASDAHPGGAKSLVIKGSTFEVGMVHHGTGSAVRSNIVVADVGLFHIDNTRVVTIRDASDRATSFEFGANIGKVEIGPGMTVVGGVKWTDGTFFPDWAAFKAAHPEVFV